MHQKEDNLIDFPLKINTTLGKTIFFQLNVLVNDFKKPLFIYIILNYLIKLLIHYFDLFVNGDESCVMYTLNNFFYKLWNSLLIFFFQLQHCHCRCNVPTYIISFLFFSISYPIRSISRCPVTRDPPFSANSVIYFKARFRSFQPSTITQERLPFVCWSMH